MLWSLTLRQDSAMADPELKMFGLVFFFFFFEEMPPGETVREAGEKDRKRKEKKLSSGHIRQSPGQA